MKDFQSHIIAAIGTIIILLLILLLLFKTILNAPIQPEDEGIVVTIGFDEEGGGMPDMVPFDQITQTELQPAPANSSQPSNNELMVQDDEESLVMNEQNDDENQQADQDELLRKQKEAEAKAEAEKIALEKALAQQQAREEAIKKAQQAIAMFGQAGTTDGANAENATTNTDDTDKGNPVGKNFGQVDGNMWTLQGRSVKTMPKPASDFNEQGKVIVNITVDKAGNVTAFSIGDGTTISDRHTRQLALDAARKAKFTEGEMPQRGKIIYNFKLN